MLRWLKKRQRAKIRAYMRGFNTLLKEDKLEYLAQIRNQLGDNPINGLTVKANFNSSINTCHHQFLIYRLINYEFNKAILTAINHPKKILYYPLPSFWREILKQRGFKLPIIYNSILWIKFNLKWYFVGISTGILEFLRILIRTKINLNKNAVFFDNLYPNNLIQSKDINAQTILGWYSHQIEAKAIQTIYHSCKASTDYILNDKEIIYIDSPIPKIDSFSKFIIFFVWFLYQSITAIFRLRDRLLFRQMVYQKLVKISSKKELFESYLFHNSGHLLRPLWTYEAEQKGSKIIFYFYSTNVSSFKVRDKSFIQDPQWQVVNWPNYWVWNQEQVNFLKSIVIAQYEATVKGIIPFSISKNRLHIDKFDLKPSLLIFDVQPYNKIFYQSLALSIDYYNEENTITFLEWIDQLAIKHEINIFIKRKRNNELVSKKYLRKINELKKNGLWNEIDPKIDAISALVKMKPIASISIPFTSTAHISKKYKIPSIYLDPTGKLDKEFYANSEVPLLSSIDELFSWFDSLNAN